jgi:hypothetical protein
MQITLNPIQSVFYATEKPLYWFCSGIGGGKTFAGSVWSVSRMLKYPRIPGLIAANTYRQLSKSTLPPFLALLRRMEIQYVLNKKPPAEWGAESDWADHDGVLTLENGAQVLIYSLENYEAVRGLSIGWAWLDETADTDPMAINVVSERLRGFDGLYPDYKYLLRITGTPNGFDHLWTMFVNPKTRDPNSGFIQGHTRENLAHLPPGFVEQLEVRLGKNLAAQQLAAQFVSLTQGRVFDFDRNKHVKPVKYDPSLPLIWSMDYNVAPMIGLVMQIVEKTVHVLDEIVLPDNAQTRACVEEFARKFGGIERTSSGLSKRAVRAWGDRAGGHRDTRGNQSDLDIMLQTLKDHFVSVQEGGDRAQRFVVDGVNAVNSLLNPSQGEPRLLVHESCEYLIRDLEQLAWKPGTKEIDKDSNKQLSHAGDALRYPLAQEFPVDSGSLPDSWAKGGIW